MPAPPDNIPACELFALIAATPRQSRLVPFPRRFPKGHAKEGEWIGDVRLMALTQTEITQAKADAVVRTMAVLKRAASKDAIARQLIAGSKDESAEVSPQSQAFREVLNLESTAQILFRCCKDPDDTAMKRPFFRVINDITNELTTDEIGALSMSYMIMMAELSPIDDDNWSSDEELEAWILKLDAGGQSGPFEAATRTPLALIRALLFSARRLRSLLRVTSSSGTPLDSAAPTSESASSESTAETSPTS